MLQYAKCLFIAFLLVLYSGCDRFSGIKGSGISKTEEKTLEKFTSINYKSLGEVKLVKGEEQSVKLTFDDNLFDMMEFRVIDGQLTISNQGSFNSHIGPKVEITVPSIRKVELSGVGSMKLADLAEEKLDVVVTGVGSLEADGKVGELKVQLEGVGAANLKGLEAESVVIAVSGVGSAEITARNSVDANTSGIGGITIHGEPKDVKKKSSGMGSIKLATGK